MIFNRKSSIEIMIDRNNLTFPSQQEVLLSGRHFKASQYLLFSIRFLEGRVGIDSGVEEKGVGS
jgi:hypothetical protein